LTHDLTRLDPVAFDPMIQPNPVTESFETIGAYLHSGLIAVSEFSRLLVYIMLLPYPFICFETANVTEITD